MHAIAEQVQETQVQNLSGAIDDTLARHGLNRVIGTGLGEFLIRDAVERIDGVKCSFVSGMYGEDVSKVFPAYAVARLV